MTGYMSVREASEKWGISERWIQKLCEENRIDGVIRFGHSWTIPSDTKKPPKLKTGKRPSEKKKDK